MTTLADDLLKTRTIPELRELISTLEKDANGKKTELQQMVGSKYHDFIQSADKITEMKSKSDLIESQIVQFWKCNQEVIMKAQDLLNQTLPENHRKSKSIEIPLITDLNSSKVWSSLNNCDVFEAAKLVDLAYLLSTRNTTLDPLACITYFSGSSQEILRKLKLTHKQKSNFASVQSLAETVVEDAKLTLFETANDVDQKYTSASINKAKSLAALSVLQSLHFEEGDAVVQNTIDCDLLSHYLEVADIRIQELFDSDLSAKHHHHRNKKNQAHDEEVDGVPDVEVLSRGLTALVAVLQEVIIDMYLLFFHNVPEQQQQQQQQSGDSSGGGRTFTGLVANFQQEFIRSIVTHLEEYAHSQQTSISNGALTMTTTPRALSQTHSAATTTLLVFDYAAYLNDLNAPHNDSSDIGEKSVKDRVNVWLTGTLKLVTDRCKAVLSSLTNASDVAMLQQRIWRVCTTISAATVKLSVPVVAQTRERSNTKSGPSTPATTNVEHEDKNASAFATEHSYTQSMWELACQELLVAKSSKTPRHKSKALQKSNAEKEKIEQRSSSNILYSTVFRISFMHQVERLLLTSCNDIFNTTKSSVVAALKIEGIAVEQNRSTGVFSVEIIPTATASSSASKSSGKVSSSESSVSEEAAISSHRIYNIAEYIRRELETLISTLYKNSNGASVAASPSLSSGSDGSSGLNEDDPHAANALAKALKLHCAQTIGQLLIFLRSVLEACRDALIQKGLLCSSSELNTLFSTSKSGAGVGHSLISKELQTLLKLYCTNSGVSSNMQTNSFIAKHSGTPAAASSSSSCSALLSSVLLLGRLAWLFKTRGKFLETSLKLAGTTNSGNNRYAINSASTSQINVTTSNAYGTKHSSVSEGNVIYNSEDQFRSAFEIADTNGDGVIHFAEAAEAIQALTIADHSGNSSGSTGHAHHSESDKTSGSNGSNANSTSNTFSYPGLSPVLTPTLTYNEFALIVGGQLISTAEQNPVGNLHSILDNIIAFSHVVYAYSVSSKLTAQFTADLCENLCLSADSKTPMDKNLERLFKISWVFKCVAGDVDDKMSVPSVCTSALSNLLHSVNKQIAMSLVSIDTMQSQIVSPYDSLHAPSLDALSLDALEVDDEEDAETRSIAALLTGSSGSAGSQSTKPSLLMLSQIASRIVYPIALAMIHRSYHNLFSAQMKQLKSAAAVAQRNSGLDTLLEDVSLQVLFDLLVCQTSAKQYCPAPPSTTTTPSHRGGQINNNLTSANQNTVFGHLLTQYYDLIDPVNADLLLPLVQESSQQCVQQTRLLLPATPSSDATSTQRVQDTFETKTAPTSSDQILSRIFPVVNPQQSIGRFALLPLALSTVTTATTPTTASARATPTRDATDVATNSGLTKSSTSNLSASLGTTKPTVAAPSSSRWW